MCYQQTISIRHIGHPVRKHKTMSFTESNEFSQRAILIVDNLGEREHMKRCYYDVLQVDRKATVGDIKSSYRKLALKYHPDKNPGDQQAKSLFLLVQQAYQTLSDPNQRTWYDTNREKILFNKQEMSKEDIEMHTFGFNIWMYFSHACFKGYDDEEGGFYPVYREVFERIKTQERKAWSNLVEEQGEHRKFQGFGDSKTGIDRVMKFYEDWSNFTTYKTFVWKEEWDTKEAPNRYIRREMEKENKKERLKEKKHYLKTIKDLIDYLKKRDPRYKAYMDEQRQIELKKEEQRKLQQQQLKIQKQQQKLISKQMQQQRLRQIEQYHRNRQQQNPHQQSSSEGQQQPASEYYCDLCQKSFKTKNQVQNHKNSKQHKQNMKVVFKEVALDGDKINMANADIEAEKGAAEQKQGKKKKRSRKKNKQQQQNQEESDEEVKEEEKESVKQPVKEPQPKIELPKQQPKPDPENGQKKKKKKKKKDQLVLSSHSSESDQQPAPSKPAPAKHQKVQAKKPEPQQSSDEQDNFMASMLRNKQQKRTVVEVPVVEIKPKVEAKVQKSDSEEQAKEKEMGKAKARRIKKAERQKQSENSKFKCSTCGLPFPSKTKLFDHIRQLGHAQGVPVKK